MHPHTHAQAHGNEAGAPANATHQARAYVGCAPRPGLHPPIARFLAQPFTRGVSRSRACPVAHARTQAGGAHGNEAGAPANATHQALMRFRACLYTVWFVFNNLTPASTRTHARTPGPEQRVGCRITEADCRQISGKYRATPSAKGIWKENKAVFTIAKVGTPHTPFRLRHALFACGGPCKSRADLGRISVKPRAAPSAVIRLTVACDGFSLLGGCNTW